MRKLSEVQEARELMQEAIDWSVFKWMLEKPKVRETADRANDALDRLERTTKARWSDLSKSAFREVSVKAKGTNRQIQNAQSSSSASRLKLLLEQVRDADGKARRARNDAEKTFDEAERKLSLTLAREGCQKALQAWELHEKAIRKAESLIDFPKSGS